MADNVTARELARRRSKSNIGQELYSQLSLHEGKRNEVYEDSEGIATIGIGFNLEEPSNRKKAESLGLSVKDMLSGKKVLSEKEIKMLFNESLKQSIDDANKFLPRAGSHPEAVQKVLVDMSFNLGLTRLNKFKNMKKALLARDYKKAANEMIDSKWYGQVGDRSKRLVKMMRSAAI